MPNLKKNLSNIEFGQGTSSISPELLQATVNRLATATKIDQRKVMIMCVLCAAIALAYFWTEAGSYRLQRIDNVKILTRSDDSTFRLSVQDPETRKWNDFAATFCDSWKVTSEAVPGATFAYLKYYDNDRKHCYDVAPHNTGYALIRGENNVPIIAVPGQTAAWTGSGETTEATQTARR